MKDKKIKIYIQYPWKTSDSQYYRSLLDNPPRRIEYLSDNKKIGMITNKTKFQIQHFLKNSMRNFLRFTGISLANIKKTEIKEEYDLIHCAHCLSKNDSPWVADFEAAWQMWVLGKKSKKSYEKIKNTLLKENCKKIIAWTEDSKKDILKEFPEIGKKIEVVPYAMPFPDKLKKKRKQNITLLFIGRYFYGKGGLHTLEVFDRLTKKYDNVAAAFISSTPRKIIEKYRQNKKIKIFGLMPYEKIKKEVFPKADIFIYPGYGDSFGFAFVEALAFGLPIVTVDGFARKNIIEEGKTGYILNRPKEFSIESIGENEKKIIDQMVNKTSLLIENKKLRQKMSKEGIKTVKNGKFSIKERNKRLERIYSEAVK